MEHWSRKEPGVFSALFPLQVSAGTCWYMPGTRRLVFLGRLVFEVVRWGLNNSETWLSARCMPLKNVVLLVVLHWLMVNNVTPGVKRRARTASAMGFPLLERFRGPAKFCAGYVTKRAVLNRTPPAYYMHY